MDEILKILLIMLISSVKFLAGPAIAYYGQLSNYSFLETNIYCITGGFGGVLFFVFLSRNVKDMFTIKRNHSAPARKFTTRNRRIVKFWRSYGLIGVAFITPVILSIPIGTFIAARYNSDRKKIFLYMFCSIVLWSIIVTSLLELFRHIPFEELNINEKV